METRRLQSTSRTLTFTCLLRGSQKVPQFCSSDLHDDYPVSCGYVQGKGDSIDGLLGRFPGVGSELEAVDFAHNIVVVDKITRFSWIRISIESLSEDGSNMSRQLLGRIHFPALQIQVKRGIGTLFLY